MSEAEIPESAAVAVDRLFKHLPVDADLTLMVLKGHLILEE